MLAPLAALVIWLGIYPSSFTHGFDASVNALVQAHVAALANPAAQPVAVAMAGK